MTTTAAARFAIAFCGLIVCVTPLEAQQYLAGPTTPVVVKNFARAESDLYVAGAVQQRGCGKFTHRREPTAIVHSVLPMRVAP